MGGAILLLPFTLSRRERGKLNLTVDSNNKLHGMPQNVWMFSVS
jgi:hypothetical protein